MKFKFDIIHRASNVHQAPCSLPRLATTNECAELIAYDIAVQRIFYYDNEPYLINPHEDVNFKQEEHDLL